MNVCTLGWAQWNLSTGLNSNLMTPDFPHNIRIRLAQLKFFLLRPDVAKSLPCWLSQFRKAELSQPTGQRQSNVRTQQKKSIVPILFLYYEESLVSSNLNSNLLWFHCVRPNIYISLQYSNKMILCLTQTFWSMNI